MNIKSKQRDISVLQARESEVLTEFLIQVQECLFIHGFRWQRKMEELRII